MTEAGVVRNVAPGADLDLRGLADVARDRSAAGRARLFALLAALLVTRWSSLTSTERTQLAELVAILWPRGNPADHARLAADLADRADVPSLLLSLVAPLQVPAPMPSVVPPSSTADTPLYLKSHEEKAVTVMARRPDQQISDQQISDDRRAEPDRARLYEVPAEAPPPAVLFVPTPDLSEIAEDVPSMAPPGAAIADDHDADDAHTVDADHAVAANRTFMADDLFFASAAMSAADQPETEALEITRAADDAPAPAVSLPNRLARVSEPLLTEPRENPHRLTSDLLSEVLAQGDLPRFEVMLAHLTQLRAPLLRRLLRDSGNESFAILGRSVGLDAGTFQQQWQQWRQHMVKLDPAGGLPDRRDGQRIGAFFAALTDQQVDRLIDRWRNDGTRLFRNAEAAQ